MPDLEPKPDLKKMTEEERVKKWNGMVRNEMLDERKTDFCIVCKFYDKKHPHSGLCRRNAPMVIPQNAQWPSVDRYDWCGEFEPQA